LDKYEYKVQSKEISNLIDKEKYTEAVNLADTIDWRRVKSVTMLLKIAALYRVNRRNEDSRAILALAYERYPTNRSVVYSLCEVSIELDDVVAAIEYYKQFVKLAPKDNGVFTLRYRILEAQEASLEERIEILEELKKRDYQEEWAYELAYLYHRVGLATQCVEECDDIILWFGDGPYVMKAMELKMLHVPLTETQQAKYYGMLNNVGINYEEKDSAGDICTDDGYDERAYANETYTPQEEAYTNKSYSQDVYPDERYANEAYTNEEYNPQTGYSEQAYADEGYANEAYTNEEYTPQTGYSEQAYANEEYAPQAEYNEGAYASEAYTAQTEYSEGTYPNEMYAQNGFVDDGYGNLSYIGSSYPDGYTGEFYVEQSYDENGNPIVPEEYENTYNASYIDDSGTDYNDTAAMQPPQYDNSQLQAENFNTGYTDTVQPEYNSTVNKAANDMSQYNTINLQKVVAEGMKEFFSEDDDIFSEEQRQIYGEEIEEKISGDTLIYENCKNFLSKKIEQLGEVPFIFDQNETVEDSGAGHSVNTRKVIQMEAGVIETAPEPNTGAISKVILPGNAARTIKEETDLNTLRDTTEQAVMAEHIRMEKNDENVYHEKNIMEIEPSPNQNAKSVTGSMRLDEVLEEWERKKLDNAKRHQEEIKKHVLTQTGKIFADFDNSLKSGILGELEREEAESRKVSDKGFLEADVTSDMPQELKETKENLEDEFEVEYITEKEKAEKLQEEQKAQYISKLGKVVAKELGEAKQGLLVEEPSVIKEVFYSEEEDTPEEAESQTNNTAVPVKSADKDEKTENQTKVAAMPVNSQEETYTESEAESFPVPADYGDEDYAEGDEAGNFTMPSDYSEEDYAEGDEAESFPVPADYGEEDYTEGDEAGNFTMPSDYSEEDYAEIDASEDEAESLTMPANYGEEDDTEIESLTMSSGYDEEDYAETDAFEDESESLTMPSRYADEGYAESEADNSTMSTSYDNEGYTDNEQSEKERYNYDRSKSLEITKRLTEKIAAYEIAKSTEDVDYVKYYGEDPYIDYAGDSQKKKTRANNTQSSYTETRAPHKDVPAELDPEDAESIAEMAQEDALKTQEIKMNTADLSSLSEKIVATTKKEATGAKREEIREFTVEEQELFENFAVTKKIKRQIIYALDNMTLAAYTGNVIITGDAGIDTARMAKNLMKKYQASDENFSGKAARITGEKLNHRNLEEIFDKLNNGGIIIEKANGMSEKKLYEMTLLLNQENLGIVVIMEDTKKEITKLLQKQAMIADYFNIRIDLMEMDNNALVAYARNYALALEYAIDELGVLALYTRIANMQSGNHVVTKDEVRGIIDEAIWKSKKSKIKNFVDVLFSRRYDSEDMIVLRERDFI